jgi:3-hydroxyisobutyrate dehydrogenase-like beta-hydroxyacid dehydrogenase
METRRGTIGDRFAASHFWQKSQASWQLSQAFNPPQIGVSGTIDTTMTDSTHRNVVGIIGLGLMGKAFAIRLLDANFTVFGYDPQVEQQEAFVKLGGQLANSNREVVKLARRVLLSLPDHHVVAQVLSDVESVLQTGQCLIDTTTGSPELAELHCEHLSSRGVGHLDATISGSSSQLAAGTAMVMVGGEYDLFLRCRDLFNCFGQKISHVGDAGAGAKMKLVTNLVLGLNRLALAEGLVFASSLGLEPSLVLEVLKSSAAYSQAMDTKGQKMIDGDFSVQARLSQHLKDVRLILQSAAGAGLNLSASRNHCRLLEQAEAIGLGDCDNSAIIQVVRESA